MIQNLRQYRVTKTQIARLETALDAAVKAAEGMDPRVASAMRRGIEAQIQELREELRAYDRISEAETLHLSSCQELGQLMIRGRIARGLTQKDLAEALHLKPQQIQRYEATDYQSVSLKRIQRIMEVLGLELESEIKLR